MIQAKLYTMKALYDALEAEDERNPKRFAVVPVGTSVPAPDKVTTIDGLLYAVDCRDMSTPCDRCELGEHNLARKGDSCEAVGPCHQAIEHLTCTGVIWVGRVEYVASRMGVVPERKDNPPTEPTEE